MRKWVELAERCEQATGPDRDIERCMCFLIPEGFQTLPNAGFTSSLDAITALIERELPGWAWKVGTCSVSDDAWLTPDFNCPMHGDRLKRELGYDRMKPGDLLDVGIDIELRPSGRTALALCAAFCRAMNEKEANA